MLKTTVGLLLAVFSVGEMTFAQGTSVIDAKLDYRARENTAGFDNDVFTLDIGHTRLKDRGDGLERGHRVEGFVGIHNADTFVGARYQLFEQTARHQYGAAVSLDSILGTNNGADIAITGARFWDNWSVYGHAGAQYVSDKTAMDGKNLAPIASLRAYYYPFETTAFSFGASLDGDDSLLHIAVEYQKAGAQNGAFVEWVVGPNGYRGEKYYNTLRMGIKATSFDGLLKARHRRTGDISYARPLDSR